MTVLGLKQVRHIQTHTSLPVASNLYVVLLPLFPRGQLLRANWSSYTCRHFHAAVHRSTPIQWLFSSGLQFTQPLCARSKFAETRGYTHTDKRGCLHLTDHTVTHAVTHTFLHLNL